MNMTDKSYRLFPQEALLLKRNLVSLNKKLRRFIFICVCLLFFDFQVSAQQPSPNFDTVSEQLNSLERENYRLKEDIDFLKSQNGNLKSKYGELEKSLNELRPFKFWAWILGTLGVGSLLGLAWLYFEFIPEKVSEQFIKEIKRHLVDRRDDLMGLLKTYDHEKSIKDKHRIILLSHRNGDDKYLYKALAQNGFYVESHTKLEQLDTIDASSKDILVINNEGDHWSGEQIISFVNSSSNYCFYFGRGFISPEGDRRNQFAAASFRTQFIGNLMNLLKYSYHPN